MSSTMRQITLNVDNMTCVNCENIIERELLKLPGVDHVTAKYSSGSVKVTYDESLLSTELIAETIEKEGYHIRRDKVHTQAGDKAKEIRAEQRSDSVEKKNDYTTVVEVLLLILALYIIGKRLGLLSLFNAFPIAREGMGYGMLFVIGLLTSVHCVAMCGGICLSQCVPKMKGAEGFDGGFAALRPSLLYNLGRVISYTVIGGIVGGLGSVISFSGTMKGIVQIIAGIFMLIMGINMLNLFPWLRKLNPRMPKIFARKIYAKRSNSSPLYIGLLNGLMPCGPLQAMQLYALSTGSPLKGAISMLLFSVGTVPLMFAFGALSSFLSKKFTGKMMKASAVLVVVLGVFMLNSGLLLSGITLPSLPSIQGTERQENVATLNKDVQLVTTGLNPGQYEPIIVQKGVPVQWTIQAEKGDINGCNNSIIIPKLGIQKDLAVGDNVIEFTPEESGTIPFSCWMGMIRSKITVVDDINQLDDEADTENLPNLLEAVIPTDEVAIAEVKDGLQTVSIEFNEKGFTPAIIIMEAGLETKWIIRSSNKSEATTVIFPYYYAQLTLKEGENPVNFIPSGDFDFLTEDEAFYGYVKVIDDIDNIDIPAIKEEVSNYQPTRLEDLLGGGAPSCH